MSRNVFLKKTFALLLLAPFMLFAQKNTDDAAKLENDFVSFSSNKNFALILFNAENIDEYPYLTLLRDKNLYHFIGNRGLLNSEKGLLFEIRKFKENDVIRYIFLNKGKSFYQKTHVKKNGQKKIGYNAFVDMKKEGFLGYLQKWNKVYLKYEKYKQSKKSIWMKMFFASASMSFAVGAVWLTAEITALYRASAESENKINPISIALLAAGTGLMSFYISFDTIRKKRIESDFKNIRNEMKKAYPKRVFYEDRKLKVEEEK